MSIPETTNTASLGRAVSTEVIRRSGGYAIPLPLGGTLPASDWRPEKMTDSRSAQEASSLEYSDDNIGLHVFGPLIAVRALDASDAFIAALDQLLPSCKHVWGPSSSPRSHRLYLLAEPRFDPNNYGSLASFGAIEGASFEVIGGPQESGAHVTLPGSTVSGEDWSWSSIGDAREPVSVLELEALISGLRLAAAVSVLAARWSSVSPMELVRSLALFLRGTQSLLADLEGVFAFGRAEADRFLAALLAVTTPVDERSGFLAAFDEAWGLPDDGLGSSPIADLPRVLGDARAMQHLYVLLSDNPDVQAIAEFFGRFIIVDEIAPGVAADLDYARKRSRPPKLYKRRHLLDAFGSKKVTLFHGGKPRQHKLADLVFELGAATHVDGLTFAPGDGRLVTRGGCTDLNMFSGFAIDPWPGDVSGDDVGMFLNYVDEVMCSRNRVSYAWVMGWMASLFREPAHPPGTALVAVGAPGVGKTFLGEHILGPIIGGGHYCKVEEVAMLTDRFTSQYTSQMLIMCEEAIHSGQRLQSEKLKGLITGRTQRHEQKGMDSVEVPHFCRYYFTSNNLTDALRIADADDRRFTVIRFNDSRKQDNRGYWRPFVEWLEQPGTRAKIHKYLLTFKYDRLHIARPVDTEAKRLIQQASMPLIDQWLAHCLDSDDHPLDEELHEHWSLAPIRNEFADEWKMHIDRAHWPEWIAPGALHESYARFVKNAGHSRRPPMNHSTFCAHLRERGLYPKEFTNDNQKRISWRPESAFAKRSERRVVKCMSRDAVERYLDENWGREPSGGRPADDADSSA